MTRNAGSIFWVIVLIAAGVLLFVPTLGYGSPVWGYIAHYWPVLVIVWGCLKFVDYYRFRKARERRPLFSVGEVASLVFVIFAGTALTTAVNISSDFGDIFGIGDIDLWDVTGNNFKFDEHEEFTIPVDSIIEIMNLFGDVEVRPSDSDRVFLDVRKTIRASNKEEAERLSKDFTFSISNDGMKYRIASNRDGVMPAPTSPLGELIPRQRYKSSLAVRVPKCELLRIENRNGKVEVHNVLVNEDISNRYGEVSLQLPSNASFEISARTEFGRIDSEFDAVKTTRSGDVSFARGDAGQGGPHIAVSARYGNIRLSKRN